MTLRTLVEEQANRIVEQAALIEKMRVEMTELLARLSMTSRNSSKPLSSDGYTKPAPKWLFGNERGQVLAKAST